MKSNYNIILIYENLIEIVNVIEKTIKLELKERFNNIDTNFSENFFIIQHNEIKEENINRNCIVLYFGSKIAFESKKCNSLIDKAFELSFYIIPIIKEGDNFYDIIPPKLQLINAFKWKDNSSKNELILKVLENLGLSEKDRKVFISYRRSDGFGMANQLFDILTKQGFDVFLDKYNVDLGKDMQKEIYKSIEDKAFLLVLESPKAYESEWISKEIHYALRSHMAVLIIKWYNTIIPIEDTEELFRIEIKEDELYFDKYSLLKDDKIQDLIYKIESEHSYGLLRRRNILIKSIEKEWSNLYRQFIYLDNWVLYFKENRYEKLSRIITITPRVPQSYDLFILDSISEKIKEHTDKLEKILFHQAYLIDFKQQEFLKWIIKEKQNIQIFRYIS
ncbi:MAG: toll/interleukin-1 receptor domain-containing protein [Candidatus Lokiarchaeota archaeon]